MIEKFQQQLDDLIKAGIDCKLNFHASMGEKHKANLASLEKFMKERETIDLKDPETQINFVKTLSPIIDSSSLPLSELVKE